MCMFACLNYLGAIYLATSMIFSWLILRCEKISGQCVYLGRVWDGTTPQNVDILRPLCEVIFQVRDPKVLRQNGAIGLQTTCHSGKPECIYRPERRAITGWLLPRQMTLKAYIYTSTHSRLHAYINKIERTTDFLMCPQCK